MEHEVISSGDKEKFVVTSSLFLKEFHEKFVDYFVCLCASYEGVIEKEEAREIATRLYEELFKSEDDISALREDIYGLMRQDRVMIGFLVTRTLFYLIENYTLFTNEKGLDSHVEQLIACVSHFIHLLESDVTAKASSFTTAFDVSFSDDITFTPTNNILEAFYKMKEDNQKVIFLNLYKGVPISSEGTITQIEGEQVTFYVDQLQEIAMKMDGQGFIVKNDYFSKHLKADIVCSNFQTNTVVLSNFIYLLNMPALQREFIRVHPDIVAKVFLRQASNLQTSGRLYDLSMNGLGVVSDENNGIFIGAKVLIEFELNSPSVPMEGDRKIEIQGEVINIIEYQGSYRYCMRIHPDRIMSEKILRYITQREHEILADLQNELREYVI